MGDEPFLKGYIRQATYCKRVRSPLIAFRKSFTYLLIYNLVLEACDLISLKSTNVSYR